MNTYTFWIITYNYHNEIEHEREHSVLAEGMEAAKSMAYAMCQSAWSWYQQAAYFTQA